MKMLEFQNLKHETRKPSSLKSIYGIRNMYAHFIFGYQDTRMYFSYISSYISTNRGGLIIKRIYTTVLITQVWIHLYFIYKFSVSFFFFLIFFFFPLLFSPIPWWRRKRKWIHFRFGSVRYKVYCKIVEALNLSTSVFRVTWLQRLNAFMKNER